MSKHQSPKATSKRTVLVMGLVSTVILGLAAALFLTPYFRTLDSNQPDAVLEINMAGWNPALVQAEAGQAVTITMINLDNQFHTDGGGWHNFVVPALDVEESVGPKQTRSFSFTATEPGEYLFYCDICCGGKDNPFMQGKLIVS